MSSSVNLDPRATKMQKIQGDADEIKGTLKGKVREATQDTIGRVVTEDEDGNPILHPDLQKKVDKTQEVAKQFKKRGDVPKAPSNDPPAPPSDPELSSCERMGNWFHNLGCGAQFGFIAVSIFSLGLIPLLTWIGFACTGKSKNS